MGDLAEAMITGSMCEGCGIPLECDECAELGIPAYCGEGCAHDRGADDTQICNHA